jgi:hypothetical protein
VADEYPLGQEITLTFKVDVAGTLTDAATVTAEVLNPDGTTTTNTLAGGTVTHSSLGTYTLTLTPPSGPYRVQWTATAPDTAQYDEFVVLGKFGLAVTTGPLAQQADVEANLGRELTSTEIDRVVALLGNASRLIRGYCRQDFASATTTDLLRITAGRVRLPQRPVTAVTSVKLVGFDGVQRWTVPFIWDGIDEITMMGDLLVINLPEILHDVYATTAEVTYTHGYTTVPDDIVELTALMVARVFQSPASAGVNYQTAGPFSVRIADGYGSGQVVLTQDDKDYLSERGYRRSVYAVGLL